MSDTNLDRSRLFSGLSADDVAIVAGACEERMLLAGESLFAENDPGESLFIVQVGRVEIFKHIRGDVDRVLATLGPGDVIGEMSFIDRSRRSAGARTTDPGEFLVLTASAFQAVSEAHPRIGATLFRNLASIVAARLRTTNELYREAVLTGLEATGAAALNLKDLAEDMRPVTLHLTSGAAVVGRILQVDHHAAGFAIVLKGKDEKLSMVPYHAVMRIELG